MRIIRGSLVESFIVGVLVLSGGCSSSNLTPDSSTVKASRESPSADCVEISKLTGTTLSVKGTADDALEDLKKDASKRGANYVKIDSYSAYGTTVSGTAFKCP